MHFRESELIFASSARGSVCTPRIMAAAYRLILSQLVARGWSAPREAIKLSRGRLVWIYLRGLLA
jgi:phytoene synthase